MNDTDEVREDVVLDVSEDRVKEPSDSERIDVLEETLSSQGKQIADIANEQEKIVDILEQISEKVLSQSTDKVEMVEEETSEIAENSVEPDVVNEESSEEATIEATEEVEEAGEEEKEETDEDEEETSEPEVETNSETETSKEAEGEAKEETVEEVTEEEPQEEKEIEKMTEEQINALKEAIKNEILDAQVEAPKVVETAEEKTDEPAVEKNWRKRYNDQISAAWDAYRLHNAAAAEKLASINKFNLEEKIKNASDSEVMTIETLDDFVLPAEVDRMIHGKRTNYAPFLDAIEYVQTDRLSFAYATRIGDIDMQNVALCDDGEDGNLKPISTYELQKGVAQMEEMAAVTPICDNATKYLAADILSDVAAGYRTDYDRKLAQLAIIRFQQAVEATGNKVDFDGADSTEALVDFIKATTQVSDGVTNGKFVFTAKTKAKLLEYFLKAGANNEMGHDIMTTGEFPTIFGYPYVVVPNDLMPTLGEGDTKSFKATNNVTGVLETVTITAPVFYGDLDEYRGKTSGALKYDVSAEASYEIADGTVRSAWQRNELVLRGSFLRGGYVADQTAIAALVPASN
ncbi:MAG: hypothetical protein IJ122_06110 [Methanobrevibacter sp.]|nr:hypothetical protein [Methanobrevibacter sp.]